MQMIPVVGTAVGNIFALVNKKYVEIARRSPQQGFAVTDLHFAHDTLYDAGQYKKIYNTLEDEVLVEGDDNLRGLQHFEGQLWYIERGKGIRTLGSPDIITSPDKPRALAVYNNQLIHATDFKPIQYTHTGELIDNNDLPVDDMEVHKGDIYLCGRKHDGFGYIRRTIDLKCLALERDLYGLALHPDTGRIWCAGPAVFMVNNQLKKVRSVKGVPNYAPITALELVPRGWLLDHLSTRQDLPHS